MPLTGSRHVRIAYCSGDFAAFGRTNDMSIFSARNNPVLLLAMALVAIAAAGLAFMESGIYDVSAASGHNPLVAWVLHKTYLQSLHRHAQDIVVPVDLLSAANVRAGARLYDSTCIYCHGAPGRPLSSIGQGILPLAPALLDLHRRNNPRMMFWVIKNGVKMTGMPSFGKTQSDQAMWQLAAFLSKGRGISATDYDALTAKPETTMTSANVESHPDAQSESGDFALEGSIKKVVHPTLRTDYPCQNLHVREPACPSR
jgi:mono/diheme cytochrome c family protein